MKGKAELLNRLQSEDVRQPKVELFEVAQVKALVEFVRPEPKRLLNDELLIIRLVVEAVRKEE